MSSNASGSGQPTEHPFSRRALRFLVVDDLPDGRYLIAKTLMRKFPNCMVTECQTAESAFEFLARNTPAFIIAHRTYEMNGPTLIRELRQRAPDTPILMSSGIDRREDALAAGADGFLTYEEWLLVGNRVLEVLEKVAGPRAANPSDTVSDSAR